MILKQNVGIEAVKFSWKPLLITTGRFVLLLAAVQALRAVIYQVLFRGLTLAGIERTNIFWSGISSATFVLVGVLLLTELHPGVSRLGLGCQGISRRERMFTLAGGLILAALTAVSIAIDPLQILPTIHSCVVIPLFEELLFRGWGWGQIEAALPAHWRGWGALILITVLFGLWHLGYTDVVALRMAAHPEFSAALGKVMASKVIIGAAVGFLAGLARQRSGRVYGSIIIHAMWNLFGK